MNTREFLRAASIADNLDPFEVPNLDDRSIDPMDYLGMQRVFELLAYYCSHKRLAMQSRARGDVEASAGYERAMRAMYTRLPKWARW